MASLREFSIWAGSTERLLSGYKLPGLGLEFKHPLPNPAQDLQALLDACKTGMQRALIALLGLEGMRLHEALACGTGHLDLNEMTISVWGKGDKVRVIPITERAWGHLAPRLITAQLNCESNLITYSDRGARNFITELGVRARISRPISSHDLRATFATLAYENSGGDIVLVQGWLGHSDVTTTQGYVNVSMNKMRQGGSF
jgi:integrase/recombinase XerD